MPESVNYRPIDVALALSLYGYNVGPTERAKKIYEHFQGDCMELEELAELLASGNPYLATELPYPTAVLYVQHALARYGHEAKRRALGNEEGEIGFMVRHSVMPDGGYAREG